MPCTNYPKAKPVALCVDDDARLYIGESLLSGLKARFTNLATGAVIELPVYRDGADVYIEGLSVTNVLTFLVELTYNGVATAFYPYELTGTNFVATTASYMGVYATFDVRVDNDYNTYTTGDQWLSI